MTTTTFDKEAIRRKYAQERDKRLRPDGPDQYVRLTGRFAHYAHDPYMPIVEREPVTDDVTFAFIGGGFAGLLVGARLKQAGVESVRIIDKAGDFGGTWYWNRYPGAMCDTASLVYMPLLEETGYMPTEKYAHGPEILEHCRRIGKQFDLYTNALFHTQVTDLRWDEQRCRWQIRTNRGDSFTARFVGMGTGPLQVPKLPGIPGIEDFAGHSFHTSRWDYGYTGGSPDGVPMDRLSDKRVAIIGTGATAVQCVPELARACKELYVFQRTPSSVDVRGNHPLDPDWFAEVTSPGWQQRWLDNFTANWEALAGVGVDEDLDDLVQDGWTDLARRLRDIMRSIPPQERSVERMMEAFEDADFAKMEEIRARVDEIVSDPRTAEHLKPWYRQLCKRPCFHDEYLQAFNLPNTHLVDTDGKGVERITERGVVAAGTHYEVDCIIYASGFFVEFGNGLPERAGYDPVGRGGISLSAHWADGMRTLHGIHVHGFPNLFIVQLGQGAALASNVPHNYVESSRTIAHVVSHAVTHGFDVAEATAEAEEAWVDLLVTNGRAFGSEDCTPGYYNNEGRPAGPKERRNFGYPFGAMAFFRLMEDWRRSASFEGLQFG
jgi:cation diffusion facilitator CzcD-associated flavoprotein CzcO